MVMGSPGQPVNTLKHKTYGTSIQGEDSPGPSQHHTPVLIEQGAPEPLEMNALIEQSGFGAFQWCYITLFGLIYFSDAAEIALNSIILSTLMCEWDLTTIEEGLIPFTVLILYAVGSIVGGKLSDQYGRKRMLIIMLPLLCLFSILSAFAPEYYSFLIFRGIVGFCIGSNTASATTFALEIVTVEKRAFAIFLINIWWVLGGCYEYLMGFFFMNEFGWRVIVLLTAIPTLITACCSFFLIESPRFLFVSGKTEEMRLGIQRMYTMNNKVVPQNKIISHVEQARGNLKELFEDPYKRTTILLTQAFFINMFIEYGAILLIPDIFVYNYCVDSTLFGDSSTCSMSNTEYFYMFCICCVCFPAIYIAYVICDYCGRLPAMLVSGIFVVISLCLLMICDGIYPMLIEAAIAVFFSVLQNAALWTFLPEYYPTYMRNAAVGFVNGFGKIGAAFGSLITEILAAESIRGVLVFYVVFGIYQIVCLCFMKEDTRGIQLEDSRNNPTLLRDPGNDELKLKGRSKR